MIRQIIIKMTVFSLILMVAALASANDVINPNFELDASGAINLSGRYFSDCLGWDGVSGSATYVMAHDGWGDAHPTAQMMARIGTDWGDTIRQNTGVVARAGTVYTLSADIKSEYAWQVVLGFQTVDGGTWGDAVDTWFTPQHHTDWRTYTAQLDTAEHPEYVGKSIGIRIRNMDGDWGRTYATNVQMALDYGPYSPWADQTVQTNTVDVTLGWKAASDPDGVYAVDPIIADQYVFMSTVTDPNLYYVGATGVDPGLTDPNSAFAVAGLPYDASYNWAVVEAMDGYEQMLTVDVSTLDDVDPNNFIGPIWSFDTLASVPVIDTQPVDVIAGVGDSAALSIEVSSITPEQYVWYKSADNANDTLGDDTPAGSTTSTLSFPSVAVSAEGYYYCVVTNDGGSTVSDVAKLAVKRQMAHWTLDQADYSGAQYQDVSTDDAVLYPADANGVPAFDTTGVDGDAVAIDAGNGWAQAGTWDPSQYSEQLTVSAWVKWDGDGLTDGIVSKRDTWTTMRWSLTMRDGGSVRFYNSSGLDAWPSDTLAVNEWTFVTATFDGTTGKVYLDGVERASDDGSLSNGTDSMIMIGALENPATGSLGALGSALDDVQIYNYALNKFQVADLYNAATGEKACILEYASQFDVANGQTNLVIGEEGFEPDCKIDISDFAVYASNWLSCGLYPNCP